MVTLKQVLSNTMGGRRFLNSFCRLRDVFAEFERALTDELMGSWLSRDLFQLYSPVSLVQRETNVKYIPQQLGHGNIGIMRTSIRISSTHRHNALTSCMNQTMEG